MKRWHLILCTIVLALLPALAAQLSFQWQPEFLRRLSLTPPCIAGVRFGCTANARMEDSNGGLSKNRCLTKVPVTFSAIATTWKCSPVVGGSIGPYAKMTCNRSPRLVKMYLFGGITVPVVAKLLLHMYFCAQEQWGTQHLFQREPHNLRWTIPSWCHADMELKPLLKEKTLHAQIYVGGSGHTAEI